MGIVTFHEDLVKSISIPYTMQSGINIAPELQQLMDTGH